MPVLRGALGADVIIIGGGLTGLSTAWHLRQRDPGAKVTLIEGSRVGGGSSGRAAGNCLDLVGESVEQLVAQFGRDQAKLVLQYGRDAFAYIESQADSLSIPYTSPRAELIEVAVTSSQVRVLERRFALLSQLGFESSRVWLDASTCKARFPDSPFFAAIASQNAKLADPRALVRRWFELARAAHIDIYENTVALRIERQGSSFLVTTPEGSIVAERVVVATNAFTDSQLGPEMTRLQRAIWTYCIATDVIDSGTWDKVGLKPNLSFYDANHLLHYFRRTEDGRLLFGGGEPGLEASTAASLESHAQALETQFRKYLPSLAHVRRATVWCGPVSITRDLTPALSSFHDGRLFLAIGCIGHGLVAAQYHGKLLADAVTGNRQTVEQFPFRSPKRWPGLGLDGVALRAMRTLFRAKDSWNASAP